MPTNAVGGWLGIFVLPLSLLAIYGLVGPFAAGSPAQFLDSLPIRYFLLALCDLPQGALLGVVLAASIRVWRERAVRLVLLGGTLVGVLFGAAAAQFDLERFLLIGFSPEIWRLMLAFGLASAVMVPLLHRSARRNQLPHPDMVPR